MASTETKIKNKKVSKRLSKQQQVTIINDDHRLVVDALRTPPCGSGCGGGGGGMSINFAHFFLSFLSSRFFSSFTHSSIHSFIHSFSQSVNNNKRQAALWFIDSWQHSSEEREQMLANVQQQISLIATSSRGSS